MIIIFKTTKIEKLIKYALLTGYVKGDVPLSLMLISPPEHAKTSVIKGIYCDKTLETSDLSPHPLTNIILPKIKNEKIHHLIIPDLVKPLSHKSATVDSTVAFLNAGMEEGIQKNMFFGQMVDFDEVVRFGIITSVTQNFFIKFFKKWNDIGFITRFIPVSYRYTETTIKEIHALIRDNELLTKYNGKENALNGMKKRFYDASKKIEVVIPEKEAAFLELQAQQIAKRVSEYSVPVFYGDKIQYIKPNMIGFRLQRQLRMLASAIAISNNRDIVDFTDVGELDKLLDFIGFPDKPIEI